MGLVDDSIDSVKAGVVCIVFAVFFFLMIPAARTAHTWYVQAENRQSQTGHMKALADAYLLEQKSEVTGNDIVEFILKHDALYDYYITVNGITYPVTKTKAQNLLMAGADENIWSEEYLLNNIFLNQTIYDSYRVFPVRMNDETVTYYFYQRQQDIISG